MIKLPDLPYVHSYIHIYIYNIYFYIITNTTFDNNRHIYRYSYRILFVEVPITAVLVFGGCCRTTTWVSVHLIFPLVDWTPPCVHEEIGNSRHLCKERHEIIKVITQTYQTLREIQCIPYSSCSMHYDNWQAGRLTMCKFVQQWVINK